ncbi:MAG: hypothetical protein MJZ89_04805 [Paludibacteraceae bacterium]|nr:hypothetical protein [Paludibacteraceae bacterium]
MNTRFCIVALLMAASTWMISCSHRPTDAEQAELLIQQSYELAQQGRYNQAKILLDSVHSTYKKCISQRKAAQALEDSIGYIEAQRTLVYSDSLLQLMLPQTDPLLKKFRYEKSEQYQDHGQYVHRLLSTGSNTSRCFLQAYVSDNRLTTVKSYYFGNASLDPQAVEMSANDDQQSFESKNAHCFEIEGYHSILTFEGEQALQMLNFISSHQSDRIRINLLGINKKEQPTNYVYYLSDNEKTALQDTYQLGILMNDIKLLEDAILRANRQIEYYQQKKYVL